tara:strand:- start:642 stop:785 length:144 start_codon:yes stop_codon:yes gene_type:complete
MNETLEFLKQYLINSENLYLLGKLQLLESQIKIEILKAEIKILNNKK